MGMRVRYKKKKMFPELQTLMLQRRNTANMTQTDAANKIGISFSAYQICESSGFMSIEIAGKIAKWLGVKL